MTIRELFVYLGFDVDTSGAEKMEKSVENVKKRQESMVSSFIKGQMIYDAGKKVISGAFNFVKESVIGATAEVERYRVTLGTMIGDQEKANKIIHELDYSPVSDFYGTANAIGGLQSLVTYGMQAEEASDALTRIGDIAQGDSEAFNSMAQNIGQIFATGKASAMDLKQFANRGFDVVGELAKIEGKSREEIEKAGVGYKEVKKALDSLTSAGGKYEGMLSKQMNTLGGVFKQFESFKAATAEGIGNAINEPLKDLLKTILDIARAGQEAFIDKFAGALKVVIHWIHQVVISFELIKMQVEESGSKFNGLKAVAKSVFGTIAKVIDRLIPIITDIISIAITLADTFGTMLAPVLDIVGNNIMTIIDYLGFLFNWVDKFLPLIGGLTAGILTLLAAAKGMAIIKEITDMGSAGMLAWAKATKIGQAAQAAFNAVAALNPVFLIVAGVVALIAALIILYKKCEPFRKFVDNLWESIKAFFVWFIDGAKNTIDSIVSFFKGLIDTIKSIFEAIRDFFSAFWEAVKAAPIAFVDFIVGIFHAVVDTIKTIFDAVKNFFVSFWEALKAGPQALADFITGIFANMFDGIRQKLFGFIDSVKEGWAKVKGIVGGAWDTAVNFVTGGKDKGKGSAKDKALTKSVETAVGNTSTYYGAQSSSNTINAPTTMNISVPQGTSAEQSQAIAEQVKYAYNNQLAYAINSSRSNIPSPERRRY